MVVADGVEPSNVTSRFARHTGCNRINGQSKTASNRTVVATLHRGGGQLCYEPRHFFPLGLELRPAGCIGLKYGERFGQKRH